jgi:hypothetical protein
MYPEAYAGLFSATSQNPMNHFAAMQALHAVELLAAGAPSSRQRLVSLSQSRDIADEEMDMLEHDDVAEDFKVVALAGEFDGI